MGYITDFDGNAKKKALLFFLNLAVAVAALAQSAVASAEEDTGYLSHRGADEAWQVTTDITKKNILMEEFTGTACYWCTEGHALAERMTRVWPGRVFPVNIHTGSLARAYKTEAGDQIGTYMNCEEAGYPCGDVNRYDFGSGYVMSRSEWLLAADNAMKEDAPVNLLMQSSYDADSRQMDVHVEGYFTADVSGEQRLCVMLLQDNVWGYQNGSVSGDYCHKHMLRQILGDGGAWGDVIEGAAKGQYFSRDYAVTLPERIGDVDVKPQDMQLVAFVSAGRTDVKQVTAARPRCDGMATPLSVSLDYPRIPVGTQYGYRFFEVLLESNCNQPVTSATFELTVGQQTSTVTANCDIAPYGFAYLQLPMDYEYSKRGTTRYDIKLTAVNGTEVEPQSLNGQFVKPTATMPQVQIRLQTDAYATQNGLTIRNEQGETVYEYGRLANGEVATVEETLTLEPEHTYCLEVTDAWGDGMQRGGKGYIELRDGDGILIAQNNVYGFGERIFFSTTVPCGIKTVLNQETGDVRCYDLQGRRVDSVQHGVVIVRHADGSAEKRIVR